MGRLDFLLVLVMCLVAVVSADITTTTIGNGDCVCATGSVNARDTDVAITTTGPALDNSDIINAMRDAYHKDHYDNQQDSASLSSWLSGNIVLTIRAGQCATINGPSTTRDGYKWYEVTYSEQTLWVAGLYLSKSTLSSCWTAPQTGPNNGACSNVQKQLSCNLLNNYRSNLTLATAHASGKIDNAFARNNLRDMCDGKQAVRSSYRCSECSRSPAPGGSVCIAESVLRYLTTLVSRGHVKVNELAGACHSCTSKHYQGLAIDLDDGARDQEYINTCNNMGGRGIDERNHIHCQFNS